jgi:hypothetical protein
MGASLGGMQFVDTPLVHGMRHDGGDEMADEVMKEVGGRLLTTRQVRPGPCSCLSWRVMACL